MHSRLPALQTPPPLGPLPQVLPNKYQGIRGGYEANILWVLNGRDAEWESRLPDATRTYLEVNRWNLLHPLNKFPLSETFRPDAPSELVTMLGQYASHQMLKAAPIITEMLRNSSSSGGSGGGSSKGDGGGGLERGRQQGVGRAGEGGVPGIRWG